MKYIGIIAAMNEEIESIMEYAREAREIEKRVREESYGIKFK